MQKREYLCDSNFLSKYIVDFFVLEFQSEFSEPIKVPPLGFPVIQFHYGKQANFYNRPSLNDTAIVIGQITRHVLLRPQKGIKFIGVNFKPYGLYNLFNFIPQIITDGAADLAALFEQTAVDELLFNLRETESDFSRIQKITTFLEEQAKKKYQRQNCVYDALVDKMMAINGLATLEDLLHGKMSLRNLQRYFKLHIGISPKLFLQILRHKFILKQLFADPTFNWKNPLLDGYYYDQSHFTRDFQKFSFQKPIEYLRIPLEFSRHLV